MGGGDAAYHLALLVSHVRQCFAHECDLDRIQRMEVGVRKKGKRRGASFLVNFTP